MRKPGIVKRRSHSNGCDMKGKRNDALLAAAHAAGRSSEGMKSVLDICKGLQEAMQPFADLQRQIGAIRAPRLAVGRPDLAVRRIIESQGRLARSVAQLQRDVLLAFYDFPAEHWKHIRTTNPIESPFATVRLRTTKTKGCLSRMTALTMVFRLCQSAAKKWRRLDGSHQIADIIQGSNSRAEKR